MTPFTRELFFDTETFCEIDLKASGAYRYSEEVEVMITTWAIDNEEPQAIDLTQGEQLPAVLLEAIEDPRCKIIIQNSGFDRTVLRSALGIDIPPERIHDTMVCAMSHGMPGALGKLCEIFKLPIDQAKDKAGYKLIMLFCKPRPKTSKIRRATHRTHPKEWAEFVEYAKSDIRAMREIYRKCPRWNYDIGHPEHRLWCLDQRINDRGIAVDLDLVNAALGAVEQAKIDLDEAALDIHGNEDLRLTQRDAMLAMILADYGVKLPDMQSDTLRRRIEDASLPQSLRDLLSLRLSACTTSVAKYGKLLKTVCSDGVLRGLLQFCGAQRTRRWAGRLFQPQNLMRPDMKQPDIEDFITALKAGWAHMAYGDMMRGLANAMRSVLVARPGKKLVVSDLSNIEGRVAAWLAGEEWKLQAFRDFDAGTGHDLYKLAYARAFGVDPDTVDFTKRQIGKVMELMLQYEGGVGAYLTGAITYKFDIEKMAADAYPSLPAQARIDAHGMLEWRKGKKLGQYGLSDQAFVVCEAFKALWRAAHPQISSYWKELENAAKDCIFTRQPVKCRNVTFDMQGAWLRVKMPSGGYLCYPMAKVNDKGKIHYMGVNQYTRQWDRIYTYGGKIFENMCQFMARDVMASNMPAIDAAGYKIVLGVHDELICETIDDEEWTTERLSDMLASNDNWNIGLPLAAGGFETHAYRKG